MHKLDMDRNGVLNYDEFQNLMQNQNGFSSVREAFQESLMSFFVIFFCKNEHLCLNFTLDL